MALKLFLRAGLAAPVLGTFSVLLLAEANNGAFAQQRPSAAYCESYARDVSRRATRGGALGGAARGAAGGAIIGAITGSAGKGAAIGAATGGVVRGVQRHRTYDQIFRDCMAGRYSY